MGCVATLWIVLSVHSSNVYLGKRLTPVVIPGDLGLAPCVVIDAGIAQVTPFTGLLPLSENSIGLVLLRLIQCIAARVEPQLPAPPRGDRLPELQPVPAHERAEECDARTPQGALPPEGRDGRGVSPRVLLERIGLWEKAHEFPDRLSGGQQHASRRRPAGHATVAHPARRDHVATRPRAHRRGARDGARAGKDEGMTMLLANRRDGVRPRVRQPGGVP